MTTAAGSVQAAFPVHSIAPALDGDASSFLIGSIDAGGPTFLTSTPHRHDFIQIHHVTAGSGWHAVDAKRYRIEPPQIYLIARGQVHHWECERSVTGTQVLFREEFLAGMGGRAAVQHDLYADGMTILHPTAPQLERVERLLDEMRAEYAAFDAGRQLALQNLLVVLLLHCRRMAPQPPATPRSNLYRQFVRLVTSRPSVRLTVGACADRLGVTPGHLYDLISEESGSTPGKLIRAATLNEAQRQLARTDLSCAQIAARLDFGDASYFSRFFRRESGRTPSEFRARHRDALGTFSSEA